MIPSIEEDELDSTDIIYRQAWGWQKHWEYFYAE